MYATATADGSTVSVVTDESIVSSASTAKSSQAKRRRLSSHPDCKNLTVVSHGVKRCDRVAARAGLSAFGGAGEKRLPPKKRGPVRSAHCPGVDVGAGLRHGFGFQQANSSSKSIQELESNFMLALQQPLCLPPVAQQVRKVDLEDEREVETIDKKKTQTKVVDNISPGSLEIALGRTEEGNEKLRDSSNSDGLEQVNTLLQRTDTSIHDATLLLGLSGMVSSPNKAVKGTPGSIPDTTANTISCSKSYVSSVSNFPTCQHQVLKKDATTGIANKTFPELLHEVVSDARANDCISWLPSGDQFAVTDKHRFMTILGGNSKWVSFTRRLKTWDFLRVEHPLHGRETFYHPLFKRDQPELVDIILYPDKRTSCNDVADFNDAAESSLEQKGSVSHKWARRDIEPTTDGVTSVKAENANTGRWTSTEHRLFLQGLQAHGKAWSKIATLINTRNVLQVRTHAQKYFAKLARDRASGIMDDHPDSLDISNTTAEDLLVVKKRGRGRPSKTLEAAIQQQPQGQQEAMEPKRKRGRPRKDGRDPIQRKKTPTTPVHIPTTSGTLPTTVTRSGRRTRPRREFGIDSGKSYGTIGQVVQDGVTQPEAIDAAANVSSAPTSNTQSSRKSRPDEYQIRRPSPSNVSSDEMFPAKLMSLIDAGITDSIAWLADGCTFRISDKDEFMRVASPTYFKLTKIRSFERNLLLWGFERVSMPGEPGGCWRHMYFVRGKPMLIYKMVRVKVKGSGGSPT